MASFASLRLPALAGVAGLALFGAVGAHSQTAADTVVARVGAAAITRSDLVRQLLTYFGQAGIELLTDRRILEQEVALRKLTVSDAELAERVAEVKKAGAADLAKALKEGMITEELLKSQARYALLAEKLLEAKWPVKNEDLTRISVRFARTNTQQQAKQIINEAKRGVSFELLSIREPALDGGADGGFAMPNPFLRIENPPMYRLAAQANLRPGQVTPQPLQSGEFWMVLKLEKVYGPETLSASARKDAVRRIVLSRASALFPTTRKRYRIVNTTTVATLLSDPKLPADTEVVKVGDATVTRGELVALLMQSYGKTALDQLVERRYIEHLAAQQKVSVSDAEVDARVATVKKQAEAAFKTGLDAEGISEAAWKERVRYTYLAEKVVNARAPVKPQDLERLTARYIRVATKLEADQVLQQAQSGAKFEQLVTQKSLDKSGDGFVKPKMFMRSESPEAFDAIQKARLQPGQVLPQPLAVGRFFVVLKLEARFGPELMSVKEREDAIRRINATRMNPLLDSWRGEVKVEYPLPLKNLIAAAQSDA
ncbi:MAG: SurA N-terminal domain-containing protein [Actinomycetota bacterium]